MAAPTVHPLIEPYVSRYFAGDWSVEELVKPFRAVIDDEFQRSQSTFPELMRRLLSNGSELVNNDTVKHKLAGLALLDCLLDFNDVNCTERRIEITNILRKAFENEKNIDKNLEHEYTRIVITACAQIIGHFARIATSSEIEVLENSYLQLAFRWLSFPRADLRFAAAVILAQLSINSPPLIYSKRNELFSNIYAAIRDKNAVVRSAAADTLKAGWQLVSQREDVGEYLRQALAYFYEGCKSQDKKPAPRENVIGSLLVLNIIVGGSVVGLDKLTDTIHSIGSKPYDVIEKVLFLKDSAENEIRSKVIEILPSLVNAFPSTFVQTMQFKSKPMCNNLLRFAVAYLIDVINAKTDRSLAYTALGRMYLNSSLLRTYDLREIFEVISNGFQAPFCSEALDCLGMVVSVTPSSRRLIDRHVVDSMFNGGLTVELVENLKIIVKHVPAMVPYVQSQLHSTVRSTLSQFSVCIDGTFTRTKSSSFGNGAERSNSKTDAAARNRASTLTRPSTAQNSTKSTSTSTSAFFSSKLGATLEATSTILKTNPMSTLVTSTLSSVRGGDNVVNGGDTGNAEQQISLSLQVLASQDLFPKRRRETASRASFGHVSDDDDHTDQQLILVKECVMMYMDDINPDIRKKAALTCLSVLDSISMGVNPGSDEIYLVISIIDRLLLLGVSDDVEDIRVNVFNGFTVSLDNQVAQSQNLNCLVEALNDEFLDVRAAAMSVLSRVAHFDSLHIMPIIRVIMKRLISQLQHSKDSQLRHESVHLLQALVRGSSTLIVPYLNQILEPLMSLLDDPSPAVVGAALSTVGELSVASPETVRRYLEKLFPRLIGALTDTNAMETREIAVVSMGKLFSSLALLTNSPYTKFPELFGVIVSAIQCEDEGASELRLQAIRTAGLLGAVDPILYQSHLRAQNKKSVEVSEKKEELLLDEASSESHEDSGDTKPMTKIERYYFSVVMRELVACLLDSSLTSQHQTALGIAFKAVRHVGPQCISLIDELIDGISARIFSAETGSSMREAFLETLTQITGVIGRRMKKYLQLITDIVTTYISEHLDQCLEMIEAVYATFSLLDFNNFILNVMPGLLDLIRLEQTADEEDDVAGLVSAKSRSKSTGAASQSVKYVKMASTNGSTNSGRKKKLLSTISILHTIANIRDALGEYKRQLMHIVIQLFDKSEIESSTRVVSLKVFMQLTSEGDIEEFGNRLIHPLMRVLSSADSDATILNVTFTTLSTLVCKLGLEYTPYIIPVRRSMAALATCPGSQRDEYEGLVSRLLKQQPLPSECGGADDLILAKRSGFKRVRAQSEPALNVGMNALETAWALANTDSASDLTDWMQRLSIELIRQCPLPIIRMCAPLTKANKTFAEQLFNASFSCIWEVLGSGDTNEVVEDIPLINGIERALNSSNIPSHIVHVLLNLVEFMDMQDKLLPIDAQILYRQAGKANMFAKCLRYLEFEFHSPNILPSSDCIEALITVNKELGKEDRAIGVLNLVKAEDMIPVKPVWLEALNRWDEARQSYHDQYTQRYSISSMAEKDRSTRVVNELGLLRCLNALGEFEELTSSALVLKEDLKKSQTDASAQSWLTEVQNLGANAAWMLGKWDSMEEFVEAEALPDIRDVELEKNPAFYKAVFAINNQKYDHARSLITAIRSNLSESVGTLLSENYSRANRAMISMQILAELEEVVEYKEGALQTAIDDRQRSSSLVLADRPRAASTVLQDRNSDPSAGRIALMRKWRGRLKAAHIDVSMYRQILGVHMLVVEPHEDLDSWLELVHLCLKEGHFSLCGNILRRLGAPIQMSNGSSDQIADLPIKPHPRVRFATFNYWWDSGERSKALGDLGRFLSSFEVDEESSTKREDTDAFDIRLFRVECLLKRAEWMREVGESPFEDVVKTLEEARNLAPSQYSVWHAWAVTNYNQLRDVISENPQAIIEEAPAPESPRRNSSVSNPPLPLALKTSPGSSEKDRKNVSFRSRNESSHYVSTADATSDSMIRYVNEGIKGFVRSIVLGQGQPIANVLQDTLRLLTLWFTYGSRGNVCEILGKELEQVSPDNWLTVIPQLIARMHTKCGEIASLLQKLLLKLATTHPQALVCPMSVALNTENVQQKKMAAEIVKEMRKSNSSLVGEASQMSRELMKVAMSPHENWHDGLELAAQQYMEFKDTKAMTKTLLELHKALTGDTGSLDFEAEGFAIDSGKVGHTTLRDISFRQSYGRVLEDAYHWIHRYSRTEKNIDLHQAWEIYQIVFKKIKAQIQNLKTIDLLHMSPALSGMRDLSLCVPGTYKPFTNVISIKSFSSDIDVIPSKQRPRRMTIMGSDGNEYQFLLKGHEDLRQDERVMQLFGLINVCFENSRTTSSYGYSIVRYSVLPLSNDSGVIGWVEGCDTLNNLVKSYREMKNIRLNLENKLLQTKCPHYLKVPVPNKVEVFTQVLEETTGQDIAKMLWLRSKTADVWVDRRSNFTKSMAVTSIVGYILGLGDRHPSNLMVERSSGRVVHIDFGDCFEVTMKRAKFPELIPFRLTRMLTTAMGRSGTEGTYRLTCERVMRVLRDNRDSVMAMLEAFVYDPLISWRLLGDDEEEPGAKKDPDSAEAQMLNAKSRDFDSDDEDDDEGLRQSLKETILSVVGPGDDEDATGRPMNPAGTLKEIAMRNMAAAEEGGASVELEENINSRALEVIGRIQAKLTGRDFAKSDDEDALDVDKQVDRLIRQATSVENLCQLYQGWCPMW